MSPVAFHWPFETAGKAVPTEDVAAAWREYRATRSDVGRETLLQRYIHLVRYMANRLARTFPPSVETEDLVSAGVLGFLRALDSYDPTFGTDFSVYALTRIRGAMVDFVREGDPIGRVTRRRLRDAARSLGELEQELGHQPSQWEAASKLGLSVDAYHRLLTYANTAAMVSLEQLEGDSDDDGQATTRAWIADPTAEDPLSGLLDKETEAAVATMVAGLSTVHQLVLHLHYVEELNFREIAMIMDVSESRTTQLHAAAVSALRSRAGAAAAR
jgi:RNA polymerase sigma factor for flagellar operon FliA